MRNHLGYLALIQLISTSISACGKHAGSALMDDSFWTAEAVEISSILGEVQESPEFIQNLSNVGSAKIGSHLPPFASATSDEAFSFNGMHVANIKTALSKVGIKAGGFDFLGQKFKSMNEVFLAHGLKGKIEADEIKAYVQIATLGLRNLSAGQVAFADLGTRKLAAAMRVSLALDALLASSKGEGLSLADSKDKGRQKSVLKGDRCDSFSSSAKANGSWLCFQREANGSIGYYADGSRKTWQDAFSGFKADICPKGAAPKDGSSWGWIPDTKSPNGGKTCYVDFGVTDETIKKDYCAKIKGLDHPDCKDGAKGSTDKPADKADEKSASKSEATSS